MAIGGVPCWRDEFAERIVELGRQGKSIAQIAADLDVSKQTLYNWTDPDHVSYNTVAVDAIQRAKDLSESWWETIGQTNLHDHIDPKGPHKRFNAKVYEMNMMNRFGWNKKEHVQQEPVHITIDAESADIAE